MSSPPTFRASRAVISAFAESDFGNDGGTNTEAHIVQLGYVLWKNLSLLSTAYFDKPTRPNA